MRRAIKNAIGATKINKLVIDYSSKYTGTYWLDRIGTCLITSKVQLPPETFSCVDSLIIEDGEDSLEKLCYRNGRLDNQVNKFFYLGRNITDKCKMEGEPELMIFGPLVNNIGKGFTNDEPIDDFIPQKIQCLRNTPFAFSNDCFSKKAYEKTEVIVPIGTLEEYINTPGWRNFIRIREYNAETDGISSREISSPQIHNHKNYIEITGLSTGEKITIYDLNGRVARSAIGSNGTTTINTSDLAKGVYIVKTQNQCIKISL